MPLNNIMKPVLIINTVMLLTNILTNIQRSTRVDVKKVIKETRKINSFTGIDMF